MRAKENRIRLRILGLTDNVKILDNACGILTVHLALGQGNHMPALYGHTLHANCLMCTISLGSFAFRKAILVPLAFVNIA